ncbi:hypothetical protein FHG87_024977 [Trinorchestia longiramus]|nr:hypothetical protein FHG87_024977 [Trinorchestia longiramus]
MEENKDLGVTIQEWGSTTHALPDSHLRRSLQKKLRVFLAPSLNKKNIRIQKESWSSVVQLGTELLLIDLEDGRGSFCTKKIDVVYCPSNDMLADIFTKGLSAEKFSRLRRKLGVVFFEKYIQCEKEC